MCLPSDTYAICTNGPNEGSGMTKARAHIDSQKAGKPSAYTITALFLVPDHWAQPTCHFSCIRKTSNLLHPVHNWQLSFSMSLSIDLAQSSGTITIRQKKNGCWFIMWWRKGSVEAPYITLFLIHCVLGKSINVTFNVGGNPDLKQIQISHEMKQWWWLIICELIK